MQAPSSGLPCLIVNPGQRFVIPWITSRTNLALVVTKAGPLQERGYSDINTIGPWITTTQFTSRALPFIRGYQLSQGGADWRDLCQRQNRITFNLDFPEKQNATLWWHTQKWTALGKLGTGQCLQKPHLITLHGAPWVVWQQNLVGRIKKRAPHPNNSILDWTATNHVLHI